MQYKNESQAQTINEQLVFINNGIPVTTSRQVAKTFKRRHANVLRDIKNMKCSKKFKQLNFELVEYTDVKGEKQPECIITKDGFAMLAFGYTGAKAMRFKEDFINRFNEMENIIRSGSIQPEFITVLNSLPARWYNNMEFLPYRRFIKMIGASVNGYAYKRIKMYPFHFKKGIDDVIYVSRIMASHIIASRQVYKNRKLLNTIQATLPGNKMQIQTT